MRKSRISGRHPSGPVRLDGTLERESAAQVV
jgi:hypothetical protein